MLVKSLTIQKENNTAKRAESVIEGKKRFRTNFGPEDPMP